MINYGFEKEKWVIREIGLNSTKQLGEFIGSVERTETLKPGAVKVVEMVPER